jgi:CxxC motif-containing protein
MRTEEMVCIMCPLGCHLTVREENGEITVTGNRCPRGVEYGRQELTEPLRILTSSVLVEHGELPLVSVKTNKPIPRKLIMQVMEILKNTRIEAPVRVGDVIINNILNTGADIIATRNVERIDVA